MSDLKAGAVSIAVVEDNALTFGADVLILKYAQFHYGVDSIVAAKLLVRYPDLATLLPPEGDVRLFPSKGLLGAAAVLFVGVPPLRRFGYPEIRDFGRRAVTALAQEASAARHIALTLHGAGFGLDWKEAFRSEVAGLLDAVIGGDVPRRLTRISIVERDSRRAQGLRSLLTTLIPTAVVTESTKIGQSADESLRSAGYASSTKPHVFVAMPFDDAMSDVFEYGIQNPINQLGYLCERADQSSFTGDVLDWIKKRIETALLVVADLTAANPNVYLELGYAWGRGKPTILTVHDTSDLKFDVRGQRCLVYKNIKNLEQLLHKELASLASASPKSGS